LRARLVVAGIALLACLALPVLAAAPLRVSTAFEVPNLTPYTPGLPEALLELVYDKLSAPSPYLANAQPWLATAIVPEGSDGRHWRINLRDGVRWHDGKPFTADDVVFTFRYYRDGTPNRWTHHVSDNPKLTTIEQIDRLSLRIGCERPCPMFDRVTAADLVILPEHLWRAVKQPHLYHGPLIGTGPYRVVSLAAGRFLRLEANHDYFGGRPRVESIIVSFIRNAATAFAALCAGEIDLVASSVPPELVSSLAARRGIGLTRVGTKPVNAFEMRLNFDREPFGDPEFRRALAFAINPEEILRRVALGQGIPGPFPALASPWTDPTVRQSDGNPRAASELFDHLGFRDRNGDGFREDKNGAALRLSLKVSSSEPLQQRAAQVVARQLNRVGLDVHVEVVDSGRMRALSSTRQFDLLIDEVTPHNLADPDQLMQSVMYGYLWREGKSFPELDGLLRQWGEASTIPTRMQAGFALQQLHSRAPVVLILYYPLSRYAFRADAYHDWRPIPGFGVFHKWSLIDFNNGAPSWAQR
jgi:peptide/nickel transport system substrate-binding protein